MSDKQCRQCGEFKEESHVCFQQRDSARERVSKILQRSPLEFTIQDLKDLHEHLWYRQWQKIIDGSYRSGYWTWKEVIDKEGGCEVEGWPIRLDYSQWQAILKSIKQFNLIAVMENTQFGFNIRMSIYDHSTPIFPGAIIAPERILIISNLNIPHKHRPSFNETWKIFSPITHEAQMAKLAKKNDFEVKDKYCYDY